MSKLGDDMKTGVLIVEDDAVPARALQRDLENLGYQVLGIAATGETAEQKAAELRPQLVLMDIRLRGKLDGIDATAQIQGRLDIPVILLTAYGDEQSLERARLVHPFGYLLKPVDRQALHITIEIALAKYLAENRLRRFVESSVDGVVIIDPDGNIIEWNASMESITGLGRLGVLGRPVWEAVKWLLPQEALNSDVLSQHQKLLAQLAETHQLAEFSQRHEVEIAHPDGRRLFLQAVVFPVETERGILVGVLVRDITQTRLVERTLRLSEQKFRGVIEQSLDGICLVKSDGAVVEWNPSMQRLTGKPRDDVLGKYLWDIMPEMLGCSEENPDTLTFKEMILQAIETGESSWLNQLRERTLYFTDGTLGVFQELVFLIPVESDVLLCAVVRDITERSRVEAILSERERRLSLITDNMLDIVGEVDMEMRLQYVSPSCQRLLGYAPDQLLGTSIYTLTHPEDLGRLLNLVQKRSFVTNEGALGLRLRHLQGNYIWVEVNGKFIEEPPGVFRGAIFSARDITDRKASQEKLRDVNEKLTGWVNDLERRNRQLALVNEMSELLQSCRDFDEAFAVVRQQVEEIFRDTSGAIYMRRNSDDPLFEAAAVWGEPPPAELVLEYQDCWAMRRMRAYMVADASNLIRCQHVLEGGAVGVRGGRKIKNSSAWGEEFFPYLCIPMAVQGDALGILHLRVMPGHLIDHWEQLAMTVGERLSLALANLELRERLHYQAFRDPLTGLYNRRYMEEALEREAQRALRRQHPLGLVMVDIDHFKQFNDTFSYAAGDTLLQSLGNFLQASVRSEDVVCRYGGEEFILILPNAPLDQTCQIAEHLRLQVKMLQVEHRGQSLGAVTLSMGVAALPEHGDGGEDLLRSVDTAIHLAKNQGRDRIVIAAM